MNGGIKIAKQLFLSEKIAPVQVEYNLE